MSESIEDDASDIFEYAWENDMTTKDKILIRDSYKKVLKKYFVDGFKAGVFLHKTMTENMADKI